jgi:polysaccharide pyruvyl transferase WcaK-like protein
MLEIEKNATIGVFGHYGNTNLGDEAIIAAVLQNIRKRLPGANLICFSSKPQDTASRHGVVAHPIRNKLGSNPAPSISSSAAASDTTVVDGDSDSWIKRTKNAIRTIKPLWYVARTLASGLRYLPSLVSEIRFLWVSFRRLRNVDVLMVTGSNQFLDNFGGPWAFPYTLLKWSLLAKLAGAKVIYVSVGAGPIDRRLSKLLIRLALLFSDYTSFRDKPSQELIHSVGFRAPSAVYPDLAFSLENIPKTSIEIENGRKGELPTVAINVMPMYSGYYWCTPDPARYQRYLARLAGFSAQLLRQGYPLFFWATQLRDEEAIDDLLVLLSEHDGIDTTSNELVRKSRTVDELLEVLHVPDITVPTRFHGTVLSLLSKKAVLAIAYYRKTHDLMTEFGQGRYSMEFETLDTDQMLFRFHALEANLNIERTKIATRLEQYRRRLTKQYDDLFGPAPSTAVACAEELAIVACKNDALQVPVADRG